MIGASGVSAVPDSARVMQTMGLKEDPTNRLLMHAMVPKISGVIGSAIVARILLSFLMLKNHNIEDSLFNDYNKVLEY